MKALLGEIYVGWFYIRCKIKLSKVLQNGNQKYKMKTTTTLGQP